MKRFILLAWLMLVSAASAQTALPFALPKCLPAGFGGTGQGFLTLDNARGTCHGWWCPDPSKASGWAGWKHCRIPGYAWSSLPAATTALAAGGVTLETFQDFVTRTQQAPTSAGVPFYNALHAEMEKAMQATRPAPPSPPAPAWVVDAATAADGTRPAYALVAGVRSTTSTARAVAGSPCRPEVAQAPAGVAGRVFASFGPSFSPGLVALCRKP